MSSNQQHLLSCHAIAEHNKTGYSLNDDHMIFDGVNIIEGKLCFFHFFSMLKGF